jgi:hypothetical protein
MNKTCTFQIMAKGTIILLIAGLFFCKCKPASRTQKRKELISKIIIAIEKYDTAQLYLLLDTGIAFKVDDREGFLSKVEYASHKFRICSSKVADTSIKLRPVPVYSQEYMLPFCRGINGEVMDDSFDILITFADYKDDRKVQGIDIVKYGKKMTRTIAPPS